MPKGLTYEEIEERFSKVGLILLDKYVKPTREKYECIDELGYRYAINTNSISNGSIPEKFNKFNKHTIENIRLFLKLEGTKTKLISDEFTDSRMELDLICGKCGSGFKKGFPSIVYSKMFYCKECMDNQNSKRKKTEEVVKYFKENFNLELIEEYVANNSPMDCKTKDGYILKHSYSNIKKTRDIYHYCFSPAYNGSNFIHNINNYFKLNNIDCVANSYEINEKYSGSGTIHCTCECGEEFETCFASIKNGRYRCDICGKITSNMENKVKIWLDENNIEYEQQKRFENCKHKRCLPFDFYIPKLNICIEVDGEGHYELVPYSDKMTIEEMQENLEKTQMRDKIKTEFCENNGIKLIRIPHYDIKRNRKKYIEILSKQIHWESCESQ